MPWSLQYTLRASRVQESLGVALPLLLELICGRLLLAINPLRPLLLLTVLQEDANVAEVLLVRSQSQETPLLGRWGLIRHRWVVKTRTGAIRLPAVPWPWACSRLCGTASCIFRGPELLL